jgi:hypothetical protein
MSNAELREALAAFFTASLHAGVNGSALRALAEKVAQHLEGISEMPLEDVEDVTRVLDREPGRWPKVLGFLARILDRSRQGTFKEKTPQLCINILVSLLRRNLPNWGEVFQTMDEWAFFATLRHALSEVSMTKESLIELMAHADSHMEAGSIRDAFICAYTDWALVNPALAMSLVDAWLAPEPWGALVEPSSIAMLVHGALKNSGTDRAFRARILDRVKSQRRLHHWYLALHVQAYAYSDPQPNFDDRCSGLVSTVEKDPLNLAGEALLLLERHLLGDPEAALLSLDLIVESVHRETGSGLPEDVAKAVSDVLYRLQHRLEPGLIVERLDSLVGFPLMDSRKITRSHHHTLDPLLAVLWEKEPAIVASFLEKYLIHHSQVIRTQRLSLEMLFSGLSHVMGPRPLGDFLLKLLFRRDPNAREIGAYLLELSLTLRCPPVELSNDLLQALTTIQAEVVILELAGRAMSGFYVPLCLRLLSLQSMLRQENADFLVEHFVRDYPGACRTVRERSNQHLHPEIVDLLDRALQSADSHHEKVRSISEIFALAPSRHRWNARLNEIVKAQRDHSDHHWLMSIASEVHLARSPRRWGVAGEPNLRGTAEIKSSFEGSRLHCCSPLRYQQLRLSLLRRSHVLLTPEGGPDAGST